MSVIIPSWIVPREESYEWLDELSTVFQPEYAQGATQRQNYGGNRLKINRSHTVRGEELAMLESMLLAADGRFATVHARAPHRLNRGSFPTSELIANNSFASGLTGFTADNAEVVLTVSNRTLRTRRVTLTLASGVIVSPVTTVTNAVYVYRVFIKPGRGPIDLSLRVGTSAGASDIVTSGTLTQPGFYEVLFTASGTTTHLSIRDNITSKSVNDYFDVPYISLARCLYVVGSSQLGSALLVGPNPVDTDGILLPGDWVSMGRKAGSLIAGCEVKQVTGALIVNTSGSSGTLNFKPQMFRSPDNVSPVVCFEPFGKYLVSNLKINNRFGVEADVSYTLEQNYD